jgi:hypothetical protein
MLVLLVSSFLSGLFILIVFLPLGIEINYRRTGKNDSLNLNLYILFRFTGLRIRIPYLKNRFITLFTEIVAEIDSLLFRLLPTKGELEVKEKIDWTEFEPVKLKQLLSLVLDRELMSIITRTLKITCYRFSWITEYGLFNPALTGVFNGLFWTIKGIILNLVTSSVSFNRNPDIEIHPDFYNQKFKTELKGIFSARLGNIILTVLKVFFYKLKGGTRLWENIQLKH